MEDAGKRSFWTASGTNRDIEHHRGLLQIL
jgi:hypothetical protein